MGEELDSESKAWKNIWSAGQGVGSVTDVPTTAELIARITREYRAANEKAAGRLTALAAE